MESILYVGMDVHKDTYSVCTYDSKSDKYIYEHKMKACSKNVIKYLETIKEKMGDVLFICGYEAGPTGFGLYRDLQKEGIACVVMAPTSLKRACGKKVKNDKVDAKQLAKTLFVKDYSSVHVSSKKEESIKEFCRMRASKKKAVKTAKQELLSFLLRQGKVYEGTYWTKKHRDWLKGLTFEEEYMQEAFNEYLVALNTLELKLQETERRLEEIADDSTVRSNVCKLKCICGIDTLTAVSIVTEVCDFDRFGRAWDFTNYVGLTIGESSSGGHEKKLGITKSGNRYLRRLLTESAKSIKRSNCRGEKSKRLLERQQGQDARVIAYADKCKARLKSKIKRLEMRGKACNVASTAAARELACFVWGMMTGNID